MQLQLETESNVEAGPTFLQHSVSWWTCVWNFWIGVLTLVSWTESSLHACCAVFWSICLFSWFLMVFNESFMKCPGLPLVTQSMTQLCTLSAYWLWVSLVCNLSLGPHKVNLILLPFTSISQLLSLIVLFKSLISLLSLLTLHSLKKLRLWWSQQCWDQGQN